MTLLPSIGLKKLPENDVLLVEEDLGSVKSTFVQIIGHNATKESKDVMYISTKRSKEDIFEQMSSIGLDGYSEKFNVLGDFNDQNALLYVLRKYNNQSVSQILHPHMQGMLDVDICIIDTFSSLFIEADVHTMVDTINSFIDAVRSNGTTFLLLSDMGIMHNRVENVMRSMVDGIIQFRTEYSGNKVNRYINIPKMRGVPPFNKMIPFNVTPTGITIDTRERIG
ncbi:MAG: RAD55 family ATPase [Methanohalobium sp.]|uniref:RAD55 family ATPase n=1 Tax=Methanohalobium sp. TaxID=2837493 RepID=UPI00397A150E